MPLQDSGDPVHQHRFPMVEERGTALEVLRRLVALQYKQREKFPLLQTRELGQAEVVQLRVMSHEYLILIRLRPFRQKQVFHQLLHFDSSS